MNRRKFLFNLTGHAILTPTVGLAYEPFKGEKYTPYKKEEGSIYSKIAKDSVSSDLSWNENPAGPSKKALAALKEVSECHRYNLQNVMLSEFKKTIGEGTGVDRSFITASPGSAELLYRMVLSLGETSKPFSIDRYDYAKVKRFARELKHPYEIIPSKKDYSIDLEQKLKLSKNKSFIYLSNPHGGHGSFIGKTAIENFIKEIDKSKPIIVDEAYIQFTSDDYEKQSAIPLTEKYKNLMVTRTFSKLHGLAGLRLGFAAYHPEFEKKFKYSAPHPKLTSGAALAAAIEAFNDQEHINSSRKYNDRVRADFEKKLKEEKIPFARTDANYISLLLSKSSKPLREKLYQKGFNLNPWVDEKYIKISIGNEKLLDQFFNLLKKEIKDYI